MASKYLLVLYISLIAKAALAIELPARHFNETLNFKPSTHYLFNNYNQCSNRVYSKNVNPADSVKTTIVTGFFSINTKRKNNTLYVEWMKTFFERVESPVVAYTSPDWVPIIGSFKKNAEVKIIPIEFDDLFFERRYNEAFWRRHINLNSER